MTHKRRARVTSMCLESNETFIDVVSVFPDAEATATMTGAATGENMDNGTSSCQNDTALSVSYKGSVQPPMSARE